MKILALIITMVVTPAWAENDKYKATQYCNKIIRPMTIMFIKARHNGKDKDIMLPKIMELPQIKDHEQLKKDIIEIASFVYNEGATVPDYRVENFLVDEWCLGQIDTFNYK